MAFKKSPVESQGSGRLGRRSLSPCDCDCRCCRCRDDRCRPGGRGSSQSGRQCRSYSRRSDASRATHGHARGAGHCNGMWRIMWRCGMSLLNCQATVIAWTTIQAACNRWVVRKTYNLPSAPPGPLAWRSFTWEGVSSGKVFLVDTIPESVGYSAQDGPSDFTGCHFSQFNHWGLGIESCMRGDNLIM